MSDYILTVGLEIHVELTTRTKMFCNSRNDSNEKRPNVNICPVCMGYPGTLPVINQEAVRKVLRLGVALDGEIADYTEFDRKNYFYPDIPKGYQISQYKHPLIKGGKLADVAITRIHLEEDTAKSTHDRGEESLLDFNRAGVPLMELVTEPVIHTSDEAVKFAKELQLLLRYLGVSEANMEKGEMRVEANISVSKDGEKGTKVEVKNLNSFKVVEKAIKCEMNRQIEVLKRGEKVVQETRGWDENKEETFSQRLKESAHDYRYFPDPDLPKLFISEIPEFSLEELRASLPTLPDQKRIKYKAIGLKDEDAELYAKNTPYFFEGGMRVAGIGTFFDKCLELCDEDRELILLVSNYLTSDVPRVAKKLIDEARNKVYTAAIYEGFPNATEFVKLMRMIKDGMINSRAAKDILEEIMRYGGEPRKIAEEKNLIQESDREVLKKVAEEILKENSKAPIEFLVGQAMKKTNGRANPQVLKEIFTRIL